ncbi:MAG: DUF169 domain-containing protein [Desulfobacterales bacterium]|jgi:hypothetical protein
MKSKIAEAIALKHHPIALIWSDEKPEGAVQFKERKWGCIMWLAAGAAKGNTAAGCQTIGIYPYQEAKSDRPRAVVGLTDLSARVHIRKQLGDHLMSFAAPLSLFNEMEANVEGSFLERPTWQSLVQGKQ